MSRFGSRQEVDAHFRHLVESARTYAIFGMDLEGRITSWNEGARRIKGYTTEEAVGQHFRMLFLPEDQERGRPEQEMRQALEQGCYTGEGVRRRKDGSAFDAEVSLHVLHDDQGTPIGFVKVTEDITERKRLQHGAERAQEFQKLLAAIVSHDLQNPLNAVQMAARRLRAQSPDEAVQTTAARISSASERASRIVSDLLDLSQAQLGSGIPVTRARGDLYTTAARVMDEHRGTFPERELILRREGDTVGHFDAARMMQVLANLLKNALTYGTPGSAVEVCVRGGPDELCVSVHNPGAPIPAQLLPHLFKAFRRGAEEKPEAKSLGLGLYIVERIAAAHGGRVAVHSTAQEGTTFEVHLPRAAT
ncbi:PAS domain S-box protein [Aggregicoccus sp. 17bor-14]|uniref:PAS domain-containing sensor histidine kinase n=1 Tax=Myxococcaceae TaxID=31 RepID=UPI00129CD8C8|nr:PAS domain-containing sensor histidine kinase [Simulacricoccus sp. 17bor-14]MRI91209.1 PAS domain S-box protein [Aggregicoccus sp. 17bor-14]